jgi:hypothetical protein
MTRQEMIETFDGPALPTVDADLMAECRKIGRAAMLNGKEVETLAASAVENASDVAGADQLSVARATMQSYVNGDTHGRDLEYLLEYCRPRSRAAAELIKQN